MQICHGQMLFNVCSVAKQIFNLGELLAIIFVQQ